jgi:hypothetical protein
MEHPRVTEAPITEATDEATGESDDMAVHGANLALDAVDDGEPPGLFAAGNPANPNFTAVEFSGQQTRFDIDSSTGGNVGAIEIRVFAPEGG